MKLTLHFLKTAGKTYVECGGQTQTVQYKGDTCVFDGLPAGTHTIRLYSRPKSLPWWRYALIWLASVLLWPLRLLLVDGFDFDENGWQGTVTPFCFDKTFAVVVDGDTVLSVKTLASKVTGECLFDTGLLFEGGEVAAVSSRTTPNIPDVYARLHWFLPVPVWGLSAIMALLVVCMVNYAEPGTVAVLSAITLLLLGLMLFGVIRFCRDARKLKNRILTHPLVTALPQETEKET